MDNEFKERTGFSGAVASTFNYTGMGLVYAYDYTAIAFKAMIKLAKKTAKIQQLFSTRESDKRLDEYQHIQNRIDQYENRIKSLYYEIGKLGAQDVDTKSTLENEDIKKLLDDVRGYEKEIKRMESRLSNIRNEKDIFERPQMNQEQFSAKMENEQLNYEESYSHLKSIIDKQMKKEKFETQSERDIFYKVSNDLLDNDPEIQVLSAAEFGKMAHPGAIPILMAATKLNLPELTNEIINALIKFNDVRAVQIFKEEISNSRFSVRIGCLRGIYKLGEDHDIATMLSDALRDKHSEVRRTAVTYLGWRDKSDVVPAIVQCLKDENERVRRATVDALSNIKDPASVLPLIKVLADEKLDIREKAYGAIRLITDEKIEFDIHLNGNKLKEEIHKLRNWWQEFRMKKMKAELSSDNFDTLDEEIIIPDLYDTDEEDDISEKLDTDIVKTSEESHDADDSKEEGNEDSKDELNAETSKNEDDTDMRREEYLKMEESHKIDDAKVNDETEISTDASNIIETHDEISTENEFSIDKTEEQTSSNTSTGENSEPANSVENIIREKVNVSDDNSSIEDANPEDSFGENNAKDKNSRN